MTIASPFERAISSHLDWLDRFQNLLDRNNAEVIDSDQVGNDTICEFGRWFHSNQDLFSDIELYNRIKKMHRIFHEHAAEINTLFNSKGDRLDIEASLFHLKESSNQLMAALRQAERQFEDNA
jgi:hypothetical protein